MGLMGIMGDMGIMGLMGGIFNLQSSIFNINKCFTK